MMKYIVSMSLAVLLSGCSAEYFEQVKQQRLQEHQLTCEEYGFNVGTEAMANCILELEKVRLIAQQCPKYCDNSRSSIFHGRGLYPHK